MPHLSYIGDATIGEDTNLGASTITANYDGYAKHRTTIGSRVHTAVDTTFVAPVKVGDDAWTGAGSVITKDVPDGALGIARERQRNIEGYDESVRAAAAAERRATSHRRSRAARPKLSMSAPEMSSTAARTILEAMSIDEVPFGPSELRADPDKRLMLFSGRANRVLAGRIADRLGVALGQVTTKTFANGEVYCRYEESVRGADVFIVQPIIGNESEGLSTNDALMELMVMVDAAVGGSAHRVIAVCPWYGYSRQDKKSAPREPITARLVARMLESAGIDRILTMDLHAGQIQGFFQKPCDHMTAMFILTQYFTDLGLDDLVVVAPDAGRVKLNKRFAAKMGADLAILNKERPAQQVAEINYVIGDVRGKTAVIVDDIIGTAGTLRAAADAVKDAGASRLYAAATHGLFSGNAFENLIASGFEQVVVTDTVPPPPAPTPPIS